jgi:hypothetical protein
MIPEMGAVVVAAEEWAATRDDTTLLAAVHALQVRRKTGGTTRQEAEREWGELVAGDQIYAGKVDRWYPVVDVVLDDKTRHVKVHAKGLKAAIVKPIDDKVLVRRSELGDAADLFVMLWSGPSSRGSKT